MFDFDAWRGGLGLPQVDPAWRAYAEPRLGEAPREPFFLADPYLAKALETVILSQESAAALFDAAALARGRDDLSRLLWLEHTRIFLEPAPAPPNIWGQPAPAGIPPAMWAMLPALALLSGFATLDALYRERGIPAEIIADTLGNVQESMTLYRQRHGWPGIGNIYLYWLSLHMRGLLYRLGRLQFEMRPLNFNIQVFRPRAGGPAAVMLGEGAPVRPDGYIHGSVGTGQDEPRAASLETDAGGWRGDALCKDGRALPGSVFLAQERWQWLAAQGDPVLAIHIPAGAPMTPEACDDSFARSRDFFARYFPDKPFQAYLCHSWLLAPEMADLTEPDSNIMAFWRRFSLFPILNNGEDVYDYVFPPKGHPQDLNDLAEGSRLQRRVKAHLLAGGVVQVGGGILLPEQAGKS